MSCELTGEDWTRSHPLLTSTFGQRDQDHGPGVWPDRQRAAASEGGERDGRLMVGLGNMGVFAVGPRCLCGACELGSQQDVATWLEGLLWSNGWAGRDGE